jgi:hypothetical protein
MITLSDYYLGRDRTHAHLLGSDLRANAARTVEVANKLLILAKGAGVTLESNGHGHMVNSGWRPPPSTLRHPPPTRARPTGSAPNSPRPKIISRSRAPKPRRCARSSKRAPPISPRARSS